MTRANIYRNVQASTASKERLMALLFETALRHIRHARTAIERKDRDTFFTLVGKASNIVIELKCTLKPEAAPELCAELSDIYGFVVDRLVKATIEPGPHWLTEAERAFAPVAEAFMQVAAQVQAGAPPAQAAR